MRQLYIYIIDRPLAFSGFARVQVLYVIVILASSWSARRNGILSVSYDMHKYSFNHETDLLIMRFDIRMLLNLGELQDAWFL